MLSENMQLECLVFVVHIIDLVLYMFHMSAGASTRSRKNCLSLQSMTI